MSGAEDEYVHALLVRGLDVAYQPVVDLASGRVVGWEALLRGELPLSGALSPLDVVGSATRVGVLDAVMRQVCEQALATATVASLRLGRRMTISVNVEPEQLRAGSRFLQWLVDRSATAPVDLLLEVSERGDLDAPEQREVLAGLQAAGLGVALDDLGAGASRMALLAEGDWTWVKLDRGFLLYGDRGLVQLRHTVAMLHELGATALLEGVEDDRQLALARDLGIPLGQGHLLGVPIPAEEVLATLPAAGP